MGFVLRLSLATAGVIALVVGGIIALTISSAMESMPCLTVYRGKGWALFNFQKFTQSRCTKRKIHK